MTSPPSPERTVEIERRVLRLLCGDTTTAELRNRIMQKLASHNWAAPEHGVVYDALAKIRYRDPASLREQLPSQATRMGFPDVDWTSYLGGPEDSAKKLTELVRELVLPSG